MSSPSRLNGAFSEERSTPGIKSFGVIREMLAMLETVTAAGQRHMMAKIRGFMSEQVAAARPAVEPRHQRELSELLEQLHKEEQRRLPDASRFSERTQSLITLMTGMR